MGNKTLDRKMAALQALRSAPQSPETQDHLRKALKDRSNYAVAKAAAVIADLQLHPLVPDLIAAFERFSTDSVKSDPQCWAKNAIAKALKDLDHRVPDVFLRGSRHVQWEPVWGGREDTAATLRGTCALALIACDLDDIDILTRLAELLADTAMPVRIDAARAIAHFGRVEGAVLLRFKALTGDREPQVVGQCLSSLLGLEPGRALQFVIQFLDNEDPDVRMEAASALCESQEAQAIQAIERFWNLRTEPDVRRTLLTLIASSPLPEAGQLLVRVIGEARCEMAAAAVQALAQSRFRSKLREEAAEAVQRNGDPRLHDAFELAFGAS